MSILRKYFPHLIIGLSMSLIMVGAYAAVGFASLTSPKALWSTNSITITGAGSAADSFKCAPAFTSPIILAVSDPLRLTVTPSSFSSCGPGFQTIMLSSHSSTPATVVVTIHRVFQYGNAILPGLTVNIVVH